MDTYIATCQSGFSINSELYGVDRKRETHRTSTRGTINLTPSSSTFQSRAAESCILLPPAYVILFFFRYHCPLSPCTMQTLWPSIFLGLVALQRLHWIYSLLCNSLLYPQFLFSLIVFYSNTYFDAHVSFLGSGTKSIKIYWQLINIARK